MTLFPRGGTQFCFRQGLAMTSRDLGRDVLGFGCSPGALEIFYARKLWADCRSLLWSTSWLTQGLRTHPESQNIMLRQWSWQCCCVRLFVKKRVSPRSFWQCVCAFPGRNRVELNQNDYYIHLVCFGGLISENHNGNLHFWSLSWFDSREW